MLVDVAGGRVGVRSRGIFTKGSKQQCVGVHPGAELKLKMEMFNHLNHLYIGNFLQIFNDIQ